MSIVVWLELKQAHRQISLVVLANAVYIIIFGLPQDVQPSIFYRKVIDIVPSQGTFREIEKEREEEKVKDQAGFEPMTY